MSFSDANAAIGPFQAAITSAPLQAFSGFDAVGTMNKWGGNPCVDVSTEPSSAAVREFECNSNHPVLGRPCNKAFSGLATLRRHNRSIHEQTKIYHCTLCPVKKFSTTQGFSHHMKVQHPTDSTMYKDKTYCPICPGKAFSRKDTLALHTKRFHANKKRQR
jgi:hypothetical protein